MFSLDKADLSVQYFELVKKNLNRIIEEEKINIDKAVDLISNAWERNGLLHVFATGHSLIVAEELFLRAGQPVNVSAIIEKDLHIISGVYSSFKEKESGLADKILSKYSFMDNDVVLIISVSGVNAVPVEGAMFFKNLGVPVIAITSIEASTRLPPRNKYNKRLYEVADIVIDNKVPYGDAVLKLDGLDYKISPLSSITGIFIANILMIKSVERLIKKGLKPKVWVSGNIPGSDKINEGYIKGLMGRIPNLGIERLLLELKEEREKPEISKVEEIGKIVLFGEIVTPDNTFHDGMIVIKNNKIAYVGEKDGRFVPSGAKVFEFEGSYILPGLIDIHIHGCELGNAFDGSVESLVRMCQKLAKHGVTGFLPTGVPLPREQMLATIRNVKNVMGENPQCSRILGLNLEGPFVNPEKSGAMIIGYMKKASLELAKEIYNVSEGKLKIMTVAPELPEALDVINWLALNNVIVSVGHTNATYEEAIRGFNAGARLATHLYNTMRGIHHRDPGVITAAIERSDVYVELIGDGIHVEAPVIKTTIKSKGIDKVIIISDATPLAGMPDGEYEFKGFPKITISEGKATLPDGTLAGSTFTLDKVLRYLRSIGFTLNEIVKMMSKNPAALLGLGNKLGDLRTGYLADLIVMDSDLNVLLTIIDGKIVFRKDLNSS